MRYKNSYFKEYKILTECYAPAEMNYYYYGIVLAMQIHFLNSKLDKLNFYPKMDATRIYFTETNYVGF